LRDIGDAWRQLDEPLSTFPAPSTSRLGIAARIAAVVLVAVLSVVSFLFFRRVPPVEHVLRYTISAPENTTQIHSFAISPDGGLLAIAAEVNGKRQLWLQPLDAPQTQPLAFTEGATYPFWSPDSRYIGFFAQGMLKRIAASGGPAEPLCDAPDARGGSWSREGVIIFSSSPGAIQRVSATGGAPTEIARGKYKHPVFLPDGRHFLYLTYQSSPEKSGVYVRLLDGKEGRRVLPDESSVAFAKGRLLFVREDTLMAQRFDGDSGEAVGEAVPVAEGVPLTTDFHYLPATASETGVLVYESRGQASQMAWYDRGGKLLDTVGAPGLVSDPALSPDQRYVLFRRQAGAYSDLWVRDLNRNMEQRVTTNASINVGSVWSPKGDRIAFASNRGGIFNLYEKTAGGTGQDEMLLANGNPKFIDQWSQDCRFIVYTEIDPKTKSDLWVLPMENGAERKPILYARSEFNEGFGQLSPDSHWMAYTTDESRQGVIYVQPFPVSESDKRMLIGQGQQPRWRRDGRELFFVETDGRTMVVPVQGLAGDQYAFETGAPQPLFEAPLSRQAGYRLEYDVTADGKRSCSTPALAARHPRPS
jgi:Tol biopolymer transport system component